ncbi:MAG: penicillin-binding protein 2 [Chloroflexi bacterium]|nr:penicillin-binding protein 2 [Chloroflexota bacterium]
MERNIARLAATVLSGLLLVALVLGYWQLWEAPALAARANNPRPYEEDQRVQRGRILDRNGVELARNGPDGTREYTYPGLVHVVGYHSPRFGSTGIEAAFDPYLRGLRSGDPIQRLRDHLLHRPTVGADIRLTIDAELTRLALEALGASAGAAVVLDPRSGEVLALASSPYFDPNQLAEQWEALRQDARAPLVPRATEGLYTPGSVFKIVTATAAIDLGKVDLTAAHDCTTDLIVDGFRIEQKNHPHLRRVTFAQDFAWSDNVTFAKAGLGLGTSGTIDFDDRAPRPYPWEREGIGRSVERLLDYAHRFGFGEQLPFDLPVAVSQVGSRSSFTPVELASTAFGQGELQVTPLLMALITATVANGGAMPAPYVAIEARRPDGYVEQLHQPGRVLRRVMQPATAAAMNRLMVQSVEEGYARPAQIPGISVGGKTGTAEVGPGHTPHSWFVGYAPADRPRVAVAVVAENRGSGSDVATPIGRRLIEAALARHAASTSEAPPTGGVDGLAAVDGEPRVTSLYCPLPARG